MIAEDGTRVVIVGGGATGALLACHLLRDPARRIAVTIVERSTVAGLGLAYGTVNPQHVLNVRASNMSAFPDRPDHFWDWLTANRLDETPGCGDAFCFVPREIYGRYLASLLLAHRGPECGLGRLDVVRGECVALRPVPCGVEAKLADGSVIAADVGVLATGNEAPRPSLPCSVNPWIPPPQAGVRSDDAVLILGSGLTMVDYVLALLQARHRGAITALSRHGLLPQAHRHVNPLPIARAEVPFGAEVSRVLHWLRAISSGGGNDGEREWRGAIDGLRPHIQEIWRTWPEPARRRFLRHARSWWDIHRHRMAPEVDRRLREAVASGQLHIVAGKVAAAEAQAGGGASVRYRRRGATTIETIRVDRIAECIGIGVNPRDSVNPVLRDLLAQGLARPDPLGIGIDVTTDCAVVDHSGKPSPRLLAAGPLTRGRFWEIVAIPDIRVQCAQITDRIAGLALIAAS